MTLDQTSTSPPGSQAPVNSSSSFSTLLSLALAPNTSGSVDQPLNLQETESDSDVLSVHDDNPSTNQPSGSSRPETNAALDNGTEIRAGLENAVSRRKQQFRGFQDPACELILLQAIAAVKPFAAPHGQVKESWEKVVDYLHEYDRKQAQDHRKDPIFTGVSHRLCQSKWAALSYDHRRYEEEMKRATGVSPDESERRLLIQEIYECEKAFIQAAKEDKESRKRKRQQMDGDRVAGAALLEASMTGPIQLPDDTTDSETPSAARSPLRRKRVHYLMLQEQYTAAVANAENQYKLQEKQLELLTRQQEERQLALQAQIERETGRQQREEDKEIERQRREDEKEKERQQREDEKEKERLRREDDKEKDRQRREDAKQEQDARQSDILSGILQNQTSMFQALLKMMAEGKK